MTRTAKYVKYAVKDDVESTDGDMYVTGCSDLFDEFLIRIGRVEREYARAAVEQMFRHSEGT